MLEKLRRLRDKGYPQEFLNRFAKYRKGYIKLPISERMLMDFDYFLRMKYIEFLRRKK